jgi:hypothetical protein
MKRIEQIATLVEKRFISMGLFEYVWNYGAAFSIAMNEDDYNSDEDLADLQHYQIYIGNEYATIRASLYDLDHDRSDYKIMRAYNFCKNYDEIVDMIFSLIMSDKYTLINHDNLIKHDQIVFHYHDYKLIVRDEGLGYRTLVIHDNNKPKDYFSHYDHVCGWNTNIHAVMLQHIEDVLEKINEGLYLPIK